jgi:hypothetical protein
MITFQPGVVRAESAERLYQAAKVDLEAGQYQRALDKLEEGLDQRSEDREQTWSILMAIAVAWQGLSRPFATLEYLQLLLHDMDQGGEPSEGWRARRAAVEQWVGELESEVLRTHGGVRVESTPGAARILVDGAAYGVKGRARTPFTIYLKPGQALVRVEREGYEPVATRFLIQPSRVAPLAVRLERALAGSLIVLTGREDASVALDGERRGQGARVTLAARAGVHRLLVEADGEVLLDQAVELRAEAVETVRVAAAIPPRAAVPASPRRAWWYDPLWGWIAVGSGAALVGAGVPFSLLAGQDYDDMEALRRQPGTDENNRKYDALSASMDDKQIIAGVLYGVGAVALVGGAVNLLVGMRRGEASASGDGIASMPVVGVLPVRRGSLLTLGWRW